jgi:hypothetical protein
MVSSQHIYLFSLKFYIMAEGLHKGTELNNINETWNENERNRQNENTGGGTGPASTEVPTTDLDRIVKEEASEYDNANKEDRILGGDRATVSDEENDNEGDV